MSSATLPAHLQRDGELPRGEGRRSAPRVGGAVCAEANRHARCAGGLALRSLRAPSRARSGCSPGPISHAWSATRRMARSPGVAHWSREDDQTRSRHTLRPRRIQRCCTRAGRRAVQFATRQLRRRRWSNCRGSSRSSASARRSAVRSSSPGHLWGVIAASSKAEQPFPADTESRIAEFTELVATAISNAESRAELSSSRADRRRRRRNAPTDRARSPRRDSAATRLARSRAARRAVHACLRSPPELREEIGRSRGRARRSHRRPARDLTWHPSGNPLRRRTETGPRTLARRSTIPVELDFPGRKPDPRAYRGRRVLRRRRVAHEHDQARARFGPCAWRSSNATASSDSRSATTASAAPIPRKGRACTGLRDRVETLGGAIDVSSRSGEGTLVVVELPL